MRFPPSTDIGDVLCRSYMEDFFQMNLGGELVSQIVDLTQACVHEWIEAGSSLVQ